MKAFGLVSLLLVVAIAGYLMMTQVSATSKSSGGVTSDANTIKAAENAARRAAGQENMGAITGAIRAYQMKFQKNPESLDQLKAEGLIDRVPEGLDYDPTTGTVKPK